MEVTVNNPDWGRVEQTTSPFAYSASRQPDNVYRPISWQSSGSIVQYTAIPNQGYEFVRWENITAEYETVETATYPDGHTEQNSWSGTRSAKSTSANPLGYTSSDASSWNGIMWAPPTWDYFGTFNDSDPACHIGASYSSSSVDRNVDEFGSTIVSGSTTISWTPLTLVAVFAPRGTTTFNISATASPAAGGNISGTGSYASGSTCTLSATPNQGYRFVRWTENGSEIPGAGATYSFTVSSNRTLVAEFDVIGYTLFASSSPRAGGVVRVGSSQAGPTASESGIRYGASAWVYATANVGYAFDEWSDGGAQNHSITVYGNTTVSAHFIPIVYTIAATPDPVAGGVVSGGGEYYYGQTCTLVATANPGWAFIRWERNGAIVGNFRTLSFQVQSSRSFTAVFSQSGTVSIRVSAAIPQGQQQAVGQVKVNDGDWTASTTQSFEIGDFVIASARSTNSSWPFACWKDDDTGTILSTYEEYSFTVTQSTRISAHFSNSRVLIFAIAYQYYFGFVQIDGEEPVRESSKYAAVGSSHRIKATPSEGYEFLYWRRWKSPDYTYFYESEITVTPQNIQDGYDLTAVFEKLYTVTATVTPPDSGEIIGIENPYRSGDECSLMASPHEGYEFDHWEDSSGTTLTTSPLYDFTFYRSDVSLVAVFKNLYSVTTSSSPSGGGTTIGGGNYKDGSPCTILAIPAEGFRFARWTRNGQTVTDEDSYSFVVTEDAHFVAEFARHDSTNRLVYDSSSSNFLVYDPVTNRLVADYYADSTAPP